MYLIATSQHYVSNLVCCFSCFIVCACFCWGRTNWAMWCYCL